jgi:transposase InsO family protein
MKDYLALFFHFIRVLIMLSRPNGFQAVVSENMAMRHQLQRHARRMKRTPKLSFWDRLLFGLLAVWIKPSRLKKVAILIKPATILRFHKAIVNRKYSQLASKKPKCRPGPKGPSQALIDFILEMKRRNPRCGNKRIAGDVFHTFGIDINKDVVRRVLAKHYKPSSPHDHDGPSWLTFLSHLKDSIWSIDFFKCESINCKSYVVMVVMDVFTRRMIGVATAPFPLCGVDVCRLFGEIIRKEPLPIYISTDNDPLFRYHRWLATLRTLEIDELKSIPYTPVSHPFIESLIGIIRREYLDHLLFFSESDLRRKLNQFKDYYNQHRVHSSLDSQTPFEKAANSTQKLAAINNYSWIKHCNGLFQTPIAA